MVKGEKVVVMENVAQLRGWPVERAELLMGRYFRDGSNFRPKLRMVIL